MAFMAAGHLSDPDSIRRSIEIMLGHELLDLHDADLAGPRYRAGGGRALAPSRGSKPPFEVSTIQVEFQPIGDAVGSIEARAGAAC